MTKVYHQEIFGLREEKYDWLKSHSISNVEWNEIEPQSPFYFFLPYNDNNLQDYKNFISVQDIFPVNVTGIVTAKDNLAIDFDKNKLLRKIEIFRNKNYDTKYLKKALNINENYQWKLEEQREEFLKDNDWRAYIIKILYRPFDIRFIYYQDNIVFRMRKKVMRHMFADNIGLITVRQVAEGKFNHAFITNSIIESRITLSNKGIGYLFPLYLYPDIDINHLFSGEQIVSEKKPNIKREVFEELQANFQKEVSPEEIFYYIYAVLYSNTYREKYKEFLKIDFPRIPFTKDYERFITLGKLGERLANIHLLKSTELDFPIAKYPEAGSNRIEKVVYETSKVWINKQQYFSNVPQEVWQYHIGGYQVCDKWLKDRKGRTLSLDEIKTYCKIVTALSKTIEIQAEIDM
ncbi:MAG TPA: helicase [Candidatus Kapabacteria bacterium]|nr:helicase [Candidatus Kapabacteria bacterium]